MNVYFNLLSALVGQSRKENGGLRFGQLLYNAITYYDEKNYSDEEFSQRLYDIEDKELVSALRQWCEFIEEHKD